MAQRMFMLGVVLLLFGFQLRLVETYVLNDKASQFIEKRLGDNKKKTQTAYTMSLDPYADPWGGSLGEPSAPVPKSFSPPRWLGLSLISVGAVLILTHPCYRQ